MGRGGVRVERWREGEGGKIYRETGREGREMDRGWEGGEKDGERGRGNKSWLVREIGSDGDVREVMMRGGVHIQREFD